MKTHIQCSDVYLPAGLREEGEFADTGGVAADRDGVTADRDGFAGNTDGDRVTTAGSPHLPIQESMPGNCSISSEICIIIYPCNTVYYSMVG